MKRDGTDARSVAHRPLTLNGLGSVSLTGRLPGHEDADWRLLLLRRTGRIPVVDLTFHALPADTLVNVLGHILSEATSGTLSLLVDPRVERRRAAVAVDIDLTEGMRFPEALDAVLRSLGGAFAWHACGPSALLLHSAVDSAQAPYTLSYRAFGADEPTLQLVQPWPDEAVDDESSFGSYGEEPVPPCAASAEPPAQPPSMRALEALLRRSLGPRAGDASITCAADVLVVTACAEVQARVTTCIRTEAGQFNVVGPR